MDLRLSTKSLMTRAEDHTHAHSGGNLRSASSNPSAIVIPSEASFFLVILVCLR
jgi:hypothetical protein